MLSVVVVYRGCADPANLPIRVNVSVNCQPQGPDSSVWWFCRGSLCNSGAFGSGDICWVPGQVEARPLPSPARNATIGGSSGTRETVIGKLSRETFEQIQARAGFGNLRPVEYGGSGLNSEQTAQYFGNHSATVERGRGDRNSQGRQNLPGSLFVSVESRKPKSNFNSSYVGLYAFSSSSFHGNRPAPGASVNFPLPDPRNGSEGHSVQGSSVQKSSSWQFPVPPVAPSSNWPNSWTSPQSQSSSVAQQATSYNSRQPEPPMPIPSYKTWNPELESGREASSRSDQQPRIALRPQGVEVDVSASYGNSGYWNNVRSQSQSSGSHSGGSSSIAEQPWVFPAFQPSGVSVSGQQQQLQGESVQGPTSKSDAEIQFIFSSRYNPCDGVCSNNPSGLYNHPAASNWFVQCGPGFDGGIACQCCRPQYQQCPRSTFFNSATKVCDEGSNIDFNAINWQPFADRRPIPEENDVSSTDSEHSNYFRVPAEGQNVALNGRVESGSSYVEVSPQSYRPEAPPSAGKSWAPQSPPADQPGSRVSYSGVISPLIVPVGLGNKQYQQQSESTEGRILASEADLQFIYSSGYNPCDWACTDNPSGLYNHPSAANWFVQCGPGFDGGIACQCCRPHYQQCPRGTVFRSTTKVCGEGSNSDSNPTVDQKYTDQKLGTWNSEISGSSGGTGYWSYVQQHQQSSGEKKGASGASEGRWIRVDAPPRSPNPETPSSGGKSWLPDVVKAPLEKIDLSSTNFPSGEGSYRSLNADQNPPQPILPDTQRSASSGTAKQHLQQQQGVISESDAEIQFIFSSTDHPCDGICAENPSGLYNHPAAPNWFVQCGPGFAGGIACQCCRPHYHQCPSDTFFSSATKVCEGGNNA